MSIIQFLDDPDWDKPFFKRLSPNDTAQASGHQAGMVLPKNLRCYLPFLDEATISRAIPTVDRSIRVEMFDGMLNVVEAYVRYQFQTWGGTRPAESRLTDGLRPLRDRASGGDLMVFQRQADGLVRFRFLLIRQGTQDFTELERCTGNRRWGAVYVDQIPMAQSEFEQAHGEFENLIKRPFQLLRSQIKRIETRQQRLARSVVFRNGVRQEYESKCAVSGINLTSPKMLKEVEGAHVVPVHRRGTDDIRNGIALTQTLHWAFDRGLFGVLPNRTIHIPRRVREMPENGFLSQFGEQPISEAKNAAKRVHPDAFQWHMDKLVSQWD